MPFGTPDDLPPEDVEDLLSLVLTTGWRERGWVPIHGGNVCRNGSSAILAAPTGGGKTTLVAALIRRGWRTLGDDKLLLRLGADGDPELRALIHTFNLHPGSRRWFPEIGDLTRLPRYSAWTEKRKVPIERIWPQATATLTRPTHLVQMQRCDDLDGIRVAALPPTAVLHALLYQTVIPTERTVAGRIMATVAQTARRLRGFRLEIGPEACCDPACLQALETWLR